MRCSEPAAWVYRPSSASRVVKAASIAGWSGPSERHKPAVHRTAAAARPVEVGEVVVAEQPSRIAMSNTFRLFPNFPTLLVLSPHTHTQTAL
jgi:hypothetical protein